MRIDKPLFWSLGIILCTCMVAGVALAGSSEESLCVPLGTLTIEAPAGVQALRSAVDFPHGQHLELSCVACHHKWTGTAENINCSTAGCHDLTASPDRESGLPAHRYFKNAYHGSCIGCHKSMVKQNLDAEKANALATVQQKTGPTGCILCHPR
jgi:hypothetical protein